MRVTEENLQRGEKLFVSQIGLEQMQADLEALRAQRSANSLVPKMRKEEIAREVGLENVYNMHFAFFSMFTHLTATGMRQLFDVNEDGRITAFRSGSYYEDAHANLGVAMVFMLSALPAVNEFCELDISKIYQRWRAVSKAFANQHKQAIKITIKIDAHRDDTKRFILSADEMLTAFRELEKVTRQHRASPLPNNSA